MRNALHLTAGVVLLVMLLGAAACGEVSLPPPPPCPTQPTSWTVRGVPLNPADFPVASRAPQSSIDIELSGDYIERRVKAQFEAATSDPASKAGVIVQSVALVEDDSTGQPTNMLIVKLSSFIRDQQGTPSGPLRSYELDLRIVPYLVTKDTMPNDNKRQAFLGTMDPGVALRFEFSRLLASSEEVKCPFSNYLQAQLDTPVLKAIFDALAAQQPVALPVKSLTDIASNLLGSTVHLVGMNVGSNGNLKIGLRFDQGTPTPFDSSTGLDYDNERYHTNADWSVRFDTTFVNAAIRKTASSKLTAVDPNLYLSDVSVQYLDTGLDISLTGSLHNCGTVPWSMEIQVLPVIRKGAADGKSVLILPMPSNLPLLWNGNLVQNSCAAIHEAFLNPSLVFGGSKQPSECSQQYGSPIDFSADPSGSDRLYATTVITDGTFSIDGRSTFVDQQLGVRTPGVPPCS